MQFESRFLRNLPRIAPRYLSFDIASSIPRELNRRGSRAGYIIISARAYTEGITYKYMHIYIYIKYISQVVAPKLGYKVYCRVNGTHERFDACVGHGECVCRYIRVSYLI